VTAAGSALGPLLGGLFIERWGWAAVFAFRIPIVVAALALSWFLPAPTRRATRAGFDAIGAALLVACMSALLFAFAVHAGPFDRAVPIAFAAVGLLALALFLLHETRTPQPLIRLTHFGSLDFAVMNVMSIAVNFAAFSILILVPYYLIRAAGLEPAVGGIVLALGAGGTIIGSWFAGRGAERLPAGSLALAGMMLSIAGLGAVSTWTDATPVVVLGAVLVVQGVGLGLFQVAYADFVTARLPVADRGVAGSLTILTRTIGVVTGATGLTAAFAHFEAVHLQAGASPPAAFLAGFQSSFRTVAEVLAGLVAISLLRPRVWLARA
jgi:predicted MFS family arabinose efflux permease